LSISDIVSAHRYGSGDGFRLRRPAVEVEMEQNVVPSLLARVAGLATLFDIVNLPTICIAFDVARIDSRAPLLFR
jgi:hypothetical protein